MQDKNIHTAGDGIFGTHVTWEDIELDMQNTLNTKAVFGKNRTVENIGDGNGFLSKICLIHPDWQGAEENANLPEKFIAKLCTALTMATFSKEMSEKADMDNFFGEGTDLLNIMEQQVKKFHNYEVNLYDLLAKYEETRIPRPKIYFTHKFSEESPLKGYLLMEHIQDVSTVHIFDNLKPETLHQPLRALAILQALTPRLTEEEKARFSTKPLQEIFGAFFSEDMHENMGKMLGSLEGERISELVKKLTENIKEVADLTYYDAIPDEMSMTKVLCHGDLWSTNVLWTKVDSDYKIAAMIDFQTSHLGNPAGDLARLFNSTLSGKDRQKHQFELLETFYSFLLEEMHGEEAPYTLEQLQEAYRRYIPIGAYMIVPMVGPMFDMICKNPDEDLKKKSYEITLEKTEAMLDDLLKYHARNQSLTNKVEAE